MTLLITSSVSSKLVSDYKELEMKNKEPNPYLEPADIIMVLTTCFLAWYFVKIMFEV